MAISANCIERIAKIFVGDEGGFFPTVSGPQIVNFFNDNFGYRDVYQYGNAPTRWRFAAEKIEELFAEGRANAFFSAALNYRYFMGGFDCTEIEAKDKEDKAFAELNRLLRPDGYYLAGQSGNYSLSEIDKDLILLGEGGFAEAYFQKSTGLVVKKLKKEALTDAGCRHRFKREFQIMQGLVDVPGVLKVFQFDEGSYSYTMERGEVTLEEFSKQPLSDDSRTALIKQVLKATSEVHERDIVHRDLSPTNIFILKGQIKIADFGLGKNLDTLTSYQTTNTQNFGQFYYCAPEQMSLLREGDKRSDVFSLGRLINFIMTNSPTNENHPYRSITIKATNPSPENRYQNAAELLSALKSRERMNQDAAITQRIEEKARTGIVDEEVIDWVLGMRPDRICQRVITEKWFEALVGRIAISNDTNASFVVSCISSGMESAARGSYEANDPFAEIAFVMLKSNIPFEVKMDAAYILAYVARCVNRFRAQHQIEELIDFGIDPLLEDILKEHPTSPRR